MKEKNNVRVSLSLPINLVEELNSWVIERGFENRSLAVANMIETQLTDHKSEIETEVMAGTITIIYDRKKNGCQENVSNLQFEYAIEVISSLRINLEQHQVMEVLVVQGPARKLKELESKLLSLKGVLSGNLNLNKSLLPPLHKREQNN